MKWLREIYWSCKFISAYAALERAHKYKDFSRVQAARRDVVLSLTQLGKYDFHFAELAHYTQLKFEEDNGTGWV